MQLENFMKLEGFGMTQQERLAEIALLEEIARPGMNDEAHVCEKREHSLQHFVPRFVQVGSSLTLVSFGCQISPRYKPLHDSNCTQPDLSILQGHDSTYRSKRRCTGRTRRHSGNSELDSKVASRESFTTKQWHACETKSSIG
jgi:hypothetical protein